MFSFHGVGLRETVGSEWDARKGDFLILGVDRDSAKVLVFSQLLFILV